MQFFLGCARTHHTQLLQLAKVDSTVPSLVHKIALELVPPTQTNSPADKQWLFIYSEEPVLCTDPMLL